MKARPKRTFEPAELTKAVERELGTKFCTNCQMRKPIEGGKVIPNKYTARWYCADCFARRKVLQATGRITG